MHPAKELLKKDIAEMKMKPKQLRATRKEYEDFTLGVFRQHIYQQRRYNRFVNYLNDQREKKYKIHTCKPVGANDNTMS